MAGGEEGDTGDAKKKKRAGRGGRAQRTKSDLAESWLFFFCALGKRRSLSGGLSWPRRGDSSPDVNQIRAHLLLICPCHLQYLLSASDGVAQRGASDRGRERGKGRDGGRVTLLQSFCVNVICPLITHSGGTEGGEMEGEEILCSAEWLTSTCK